jgi:hypothetical protein
MFNPANVKQIKLLRCFWFLTSLVDVPALDPPECLDYNCCLWQMIKWAEMVGDITVS